MKNQKKSMKKWQVVVTVSLKDGVLDPQGNAVQKATQALGFSSIQQVRVGRTLYLLCVGATQSAVQKEVEAACQRLLANPVIEKYQIVISS